MSDCQHHWKITSPDGPTSRGVCRLCGETREFANHVETSVWEPGDSHGVLTHPRRPDLLPWAPVNLIEWERGR